MSRFRVIPLAMALVGVLAGNHTTVFASEQASTELTPDSDLRDYLEYAALHNPELEAAFYRWQGALEAVPQARTLPDPRLTYATYIQSVETRVGPQENNLGVAQTLPWFGKVRAKGDVSAARADVARWRYEQSKQTLFYRVADAYAEYYFLGRSTRITEENLILLEHFEEVARRRYEVNEADYSDAVKAQVELGKLTDRLRTLNAMRPALAARLNNTLNRPAETPIPWPKALNEPSRQMDIPALRAELAQHNPVLNALRSELTAANRESELARLRKYPDVTIGVNWIDTGPAIAPTLDSGRDAVTATFSINLPIWRESYRAGERQARARVQSAIREHQARQNALVAAFEFAVFRYDDAQRKIRLFRDTLIPKAQQSVQATETAFTTGAGDFLALLDAQRLLLEFQLSSERALADAVQRDAEMAMLLGTATPSNEHAEPHGETQLRTGTDND